MKNEGNVCFKAGDYEKAVQFYTEAIKIVPPDDKPQQATFFQNRAAAHERLVILIMFSLELNVDKFSIF